ncbi:Thrombospondin-2, partial [Geodia barretti]
NKTERFQCNVHHCPVDCLWKWSDFTDCTCEDGRSLNRRRHPIIIQAPKYEGTPCPDFVVTNETEELECRDELCKQGRSCESGKSICNGECIIDKDKDCIPDNQDKCPNDPLPEKDTDDDEVGDSCDNCSEKENPEQIDSDSDRIGDECDNCRYVYNYDQSDADGDGWGDACDTCPYIYSRSNLDQDNDGWGDICDNCIFYSNPEQEDRDNDFLGYLCEADKDGDEIVNQYDNCPLLYNPYQEDSEMDGIGDACRRTLPEAALFSDVPLQIR